MSIVSYATNHYDKSNFEDPLFQLISYVYNEEKTEGIYGGINTSSNPKVAITEMKNVKSYFMKNDGRELIHIIVSDPIFDAINLNMALLIGYCIGSYYKNRFQVFFGFHHQQHKGNSCNHFHFIINSVSLFNGSKYNESFAERDIFKAYVENVISNIKNGEYIK